MGQAGSSREPAVRWRLLDQRTWLLRVVTVRQMSAVVDQRTRGAGHEGRLKSVDWRGAAQLGEAGAAPQSAQLALWQSPIRPARGPEQPSGYQPRPQDDRWAGTPSAWHRETTRDSNPTAPAGGRLPGSQPCREMFHVKHRPPQALLLVWTWTWTTGFRVRWQVGGVRFHVKHEAGAGPEGRPTPRDRWSSQLRVSQSSGEYPSLEGDSLRGGSLWEASALTTTGTSVDSSLGSPA